MFIADFMEKQQGPVCLQRDGIYGTNGNEIPAMGGWRTHKEEKSPGARQNPPSNPCVSTFPEE